MLASASSRSTLRCSTSACKLLTNTGLVISSTCCWRRFRSSSVFVHATSVQALRLHYAYELTLLTHHEGCEAHGGAHQPAVEGHDSLIDSRRAAGWSWQESPERLSKHDRASASAFRLARASEKQARMIA